MTAYGQESTPSSDSQSIAGYADHIDGTYVGTYVVFSNRIGSEVIEQTICPDSIKNPDKASPSACTLGSKSLSQEAFAHKLFFNTVREPWVADKWLDVGVSRKAVIDHWLSQLSP